MLTGNKVTHINEVRILNERNKVTKEIKITRDIVSYRRYTDESQSLIAISRHDASTYVYDHRSVRVLCRLLVDMAMHHDVHMIT